MNYTYQNFASLGVNLNRQSYGSLDISQVFNSRADLNYYISKGAITEGVSEYWQSIVPYPYNGQMLALVEGNDVHFYGLKENAEGTFDTVTLGSAVKGDEVSIIKNDDGTLTLKGFAEAAEGAQPRKNAQGEIEWIVPSTEILEGLQTTVAALQNDVKNIQTTVGDDSKGLVKGVADNTAGITAINNKIGTVTENKTIVEMISDAQTAATYDDTVLKGRVTAAENDIDALQIQIGGLTGAMHFVGISSTDPAAGATVGDKTTFTSGDVVLYETKEYVYDGTEWVLLGDEGSYLTKDSAATTYETKNDANTKNQALEQRIKALEDVGSEANVIESVETTQMKIAEKKLEIIAIDKSLVTGLDSALEQKVNVEEGKGLSTNDYTTAEKEKLAAIAEGANVNVIESIKVNGSVVDVAEDKSIDIAVPVTSTLENQVSIGLDKKMTVNNINVNKLVQTEGTFIILNGGTSAGIAEQ